jgi:hypothetical protein
MRAIALAVLLASVFGVYGAFADSSSAYPYCLMTGPAQDRSYNTMAQCLVIWNRSWPHYRRALGASKGERLWRMQLGEAGRSRRWC